MGSGFRGFWAIGFRGLVFPLGQLEGLIIRLGTGQYRGQNN